MRAPELPALPGVEHATRDGDRWTLHTADADELVRDLVRSGVGFTDLGVARASLEEAFLSLTGAPS